MSVTETEQAIDVDLDATVPCETQTFGPCAREAAWIARRPCCGYTVLFCHEHRAASLAFGEAERTAAHELGTDVPCRRCGVTPRPRFTWRPL